MGFLSGISNAIKGMKLGDVLKSRNGIKNLGKACFMSIENSVSKANTLMGELANKVNEALGININSLNKRYKYC